MERFMIWLKRYLSLLIPLVALLVGIESILLISRAVLNHEEVIGKNYSIIIVSSAELSEATLKEKISDIFAINKIETGGIFDEINAEFKDSLRGDIEPSLPFFYSITLNSFPNQNKIKQIESSLSAIEGVSRVESFTKTHTQTYRLLVLIKGCVMMFSGLVFVLSFLLMIKQVEVWRFEHSERMEIMTYLGAPSRLKNMPLYRLALIDSLIASLIVMVLVFIFLSSDRINSILSMLGVKLLDISTLMLDYFILLFSAYIISMVSVFMVILFQKEP